VKTEEVQTNHHYRTVNFERRKYPRFDVDLPLKYVPSDMSVNLGRTVNASEGGLLISVREKMEVGQSLKITLFLLPGTELVSIKAKGEIVWKDIDCGGDPGHHRFGIKFVDISDKDLERLKGLLRNLDRDRTHI